MSESKVIPGTEAGSVEEIKGIVDTIGEAMMPIDEILAKTREAFSTINNFERVVEINQLVGNMSNFSHEAMKRQKSVIEREVEKMWTHIEEGNLAEVRAGIGNMLFAAYAMAAHLGIPANTDFKKICESQFSKFDKTEQDATATKDKYLALNVVTGYCEQTTRSGDKVFITYSAIDQVGLDGKHYHAGKWLKSVHFKEPEFTPLYSDSVRAIT